MNDDMGKPDFGDPNKLKLYFDDIDDEIANLHGLLQSQRAELSAQRTALIALLSALDDIHPALCDLVVDDLSAALTRAFNPPGDLEPDEHDCDALSELISKIAHAKKRFER